MRVFTFALALSLGLGVVVVTAAPAPAFAQDGKPDYAAAKRHYQAALAAEKAGDYATAVAEYAAAYDITKDPKVLYAIARSYEAAGNKDAAVVYYRRYLNEAKDAKDRDAVKEKIAALEKTDAPPPGGGGDVQPPGGGGDVQPPGGGDTLVPPGGGGTPPGGGEDPPGGGTPPGGDVPSFGDGGSRWQRTAGWVAVGVAAVALTTGAVLGESALSREEDIQRLIDYRDQNAMLPSEYSGNVQREYEDAVAEGDRYETYSIIAFSVAGAAAVAAAVFFVIDPGPAEAPEATSQGKDGKKLVKKAAPRRWISATPSADGVGVVAGFRF